MKYKLKYVKGEGIFKEEGWCDCTGKIDRIITFNLQVY